LFGRFMRLREDDLPQGPSEDLPPREAILEHVLALIELIGGPDMTGAADKAIVGDLKITGSDDVDFLDALEEQYGIDLQPFVDARTVRWKRWFWTSRGASGITPRELAEEIRRLLVLREGRQ
jgi:hypothetical protein